jgi:hemerythrin-like metal-binding protein
MSKIYFLWDEKFSVQIAEIDEQHKKLFDLLNELYNAFACKKHQTEIKGIIEKLVDYTNFHFTHEEKYFRRFNYEDSKSHVEEHHSFINTIKQYQNDAIQNPVMLTYKTMTFLQNWITNHILVNDKKYVNCFKENGLA